MELVVLVVAAAAYGIIYTAAPNRRSLRVRRTTVTRRLLIIGSVGLAMCAALAAATLGPAIGPMVALTGAMASGSVLSVVCPFACRTDGRAAAVAEIAETVDAVDTVDEIDEVDPQEDA